MDRKNFLSQFFKYTVVGFSTYLIDYLIFAILIFFDFHYQLATFLGLIIGLSLNYMWSGRWVFKRKKKKILRRILDFCITNGGAFIINSLLMWFFVGVGGFNEYLSKIVASFVVFFYNFIIRRYYVFKK